MYYYIGGAKQESQHFQQFHRECFRNIAGDQHMAPEDREKTEKGREKNTSAARFQQRIKDIINEIDDEISA